MKLVSHPHIGTQNGSVDNDRKGGVLHSGKQRYLLLCQTSSRASSVAHHQKEVHILRRLSLPQR